ncbi:protein-export chaperone SecB [Endozoicomonas numazuensis]|uniref:Preprotein translocase subunit SecB n=1 Tax=Endozoicomonas numazuensis TaxID=1137799 RepID=A0A081NLI5_9GAMM|nr:protein-export chaperone SecB [Endozoicomonas numazuensis]KEQ19308.1 hypothetical protein GZ78_04840 [Endozoicomonas numazuensis]
MSTDVSLSPLQTRQLLFSKVLVEPCDFPADEKIWAPGFDFKDVKIETTLEVGCKEGEEEDPRNYLVTVRILIANEQGKKAPYTVDIEAQAWIELQPVFDIDKREAIMCVNGPTVVAGAIREVVTQLTARSFYGALVLPTLRFQSGDHEG